MIVNKTKLFVLINSYYSDIIVFLVFLFILYYKNICNK